MKSVYVHDLVNNQIFDDETFAVSQASINTGKNGKPYMNVVLSDKTGSIAAKIWSDVLEHINKKIIKEGNLIAVTGEVSEYKGALQIKILDVSQVDESDLDEFIASSQYDPDDMLKKLQDNIDLIKNLKLKKVVMHVIDDKDVLRKFKYWPAGNSIHHGFRSGLLQHILEMFEIAKSLHTYYPNINYDVLYTGIVFHDIGKLEELSGGLSSNYTKKGGLLGHISIGAQMFLDFGGNKLDEDTKDHVLHLILSHHGKLEYGSPIVPSTPEAVALHYIDNLSSKLQAALTIVAQIPDETEFSAPSYFIEGARFWKNHTNGIDIDETEDSIDQLPLT